MGSGEDGVSLQRLKKQPQCVESQQPRIPEETALKDATTPASASVVRVYSRRWLMLALYLGVITLNSVPYMQYTVVGDILSQYYGVSKNNLEWMTMVSSATAALFIFPAAWVLDKYGLRVSVLVGAAGTAAGIWLKTLGCRADGYWLAMSGQALVAIATLFVVSSAPTRMAAVWFPPGEVSGAVGGSYLVIMLGIAVGCGIAPLSVNEKVPEETYYGLLTANVGLGVVATLLLVAVIFLFQDKPPLPPSPSQAAKASPASAAASNALTFFRSLWRIMRDPHFVILLFACALFSSTLIGFSVLMDRTVVFFFPDNKTDTGYIGMFMTLGGIVGIILIGFLVSYTRLYKEWAVLIYTFALLGAIAYSVSVSKSDSIYYVYASAIMLGFFMPCFYVPGLALAVELTYPEPEGNPTAIINWLIQPTALLVKMGYTLLFEEVSPDIAHIVQCSLLVIGLVCITCVPKKYKRREAERLAHQEATKDVNGGPGPEEGMLTVVD